MSALATVLASLPHLPPLARLGALPLGTAGLEARLAPLPVPLRDELAALRAWLWSAARPELGRDAARVAAEWEPIRQGFAALRAARRGRDAPRPRAAPWHGEAAALLDSDPAAAERLRLALFAGRLERLAFARGADPLRLFATVARWDAAERWARPAGAAAAARLQGLAEARIHG